MIPDKQATLFYWLWLSHRCRPGSSENELLLDHFYRDPKKIYEASEKELLSLPDLSPALRKRLCDKGEEDALRERNYCVQNNVGILTLDDPLYPRRLLSVPNMPLLLYYRGRLPDWNQDLCIATVGTRRMSEYGKREAYTISYDLARCGVVIVSGMARGVDGACHRAALDAGGHTVAVLGCGIERVYPPEHAELMEEIAAKGTLLTEFSPFTEPNGCNFPIRNRIISGLSQGTLVIEADAKSGAMITARLAKKQGRTVFSLPGKVGELNSLGTNALLREGAIAVTKAEDLLAEFAPLYTERLHPEALRVGRPSYAPSRPPLARKKGAGKPAEGAASFLRPEEEEPPLKEEPLPAPEPPFDPFPHKKKAAAERRAGPGKKASESAFDPFSRQRNEAAERRAGPDKKAQEPAEEALPADLSDEVQRAVYRRLLPGNIYTTDELLLEGVPLQKILSTLTLLELRGYVEALPGGRFQRRQKLP